MPPARCSSDAAPASRPLLIIHGLSDDNVVAAHSLRLSSALLAAGRQHSLLPLSGVTHMTPQEVVAENLLLLQVEFVQQALGRQLELVGDAPRLTPGATIAPPRSTSSGKWQATSWPGPMPAGCGSPSRRPPGPSSTGCGTRSRTAGCSGWAGRPCSRIRSRPLRVRGPARARPRAARACRGAAASGTGPRESADSMILPRYMTIDPVGDVPDDGQVVRDEQIGQPELVLQVLEQVDDLGLDRHVEGRDRLVADDQLGPQGHGPGDADALPLAAGELVGVAVVVLGVEADPLHQVLDRALDATGRIDALDLERRRDDAADRVPGFSDE